MLVWLCSECLREAPAAPGLPLGFAEPCPHCDGVAEIVIDDVPSERARLRLAKVAGRIAAISMRQRERNWRRGKGLA